MATSASYVKLGGVPLDMPDGADRYWALTDGPKANQQVFRVHKDQAAKILKRGQRQLSQFTGTRVRDKPIPVGPLTFEVKHQGGKAKTIHGLYVLFANPSTDPNFVELVVSDFRWLWSRTLVVLTANARRRSGERRLLLSQPGTPVQVAQKVDDFTYRTITLKAPGQPYTARDLLEWILTELMGAGNFTIGATPLQEPVESLELRDPGPEALARVLAKLPGITITPTASGKVRAFNTLDRSEVVAAKRVEAARIFGMGEWREVDFSFVRPPAVFGHIDREMEVRFDFKNSTSGTAVRATPGREEPELEMMIPVPDPEITVAGRKAVYGTWVRMSDYLDAVNANADGLAVLPAAGALDDAKIRRWYLSGFSFLHHLFTLDAGAGTPNPVWSRRLNAIQEHWRRTFRIPPEWMDKVKSVRAHRAAIIDEENGVRARSDAYFDHTVKPTFRSIALKGGAQLGWEVTGYAADLADAKPSPAEVEVLAEDLGILRITPRVDPFGVGAVVAPGTLDSSSSMPSADAAETVILWNQVSLAEDWNLAVVVTMAPDSPNELGRLRSEKVTPSQAAKHLPGVKGIGPCKGVDWHVYCGETTARYAWMDGQADAIKEAVWSGKEPPESLLTNPAELRAVAEAQAARIYSTLIDRGMGSFYVSLDPSVVPTGNLRRVSYGLRRTGGEYFAYTKLEMPPVTVPPSVWSLMPEQHRRRLLKLVQL